MRRDKQPAIGETVPAHTPDQWRAQLGQDVEQLITGERQFQAHRAAEIGEAAKASGVEISVNLQNAEAALERLEQHTQELHRLQFLMRDAKHEFVERVVKEGWIDLLSVNVGGFKRRMRFVKNPR